MTFLVGGTLFFWGTVGVAFDRHIHDVYGLVLGLILLALSIGE